MNINRTKKIGSYFSYIIIVLGGAIILSLGCGGGPSTSPFGHWEGPTSEVRISLSADMRVNIVTDISGNLTCKDASDTTDGSGGADGVDSINDTASLECVFSLGTLNTTDNGYVPIVYAPAESCVGHPTYSQNNCIECNISAPGDICSVSCSGIVPSNTTIASDSITLIFEAFADLDTDMPAPDGAVRIDGVIDNWPDLDATTDLSYDYTACDGSPDMELNTSSDPNGDNSTNSTEWNHTRSITTVGDGSCDIIAKLEHTYAFTGAEDGSTWALDITGDTIEVGAQICDDESNCPTLFPSGATFAKSFGDTDYDVLSRGIHVLSDGSIVAGGYTASFGAGGNDMWLMKLDSFGDIVWQYAYGTSSRSENAAYVAETGDGGFILAGNSSSGSDYELQVIKVDSSGTVEWEYRYELAEGVYGYDDVARCITQTDDGGYAIAGRTANYAAGNNDAWVIKLNSNGSVAWDKIMGGTGGENFDVIFQTSDGNYLAAGNSSFSGSSDVWVVKLNSSGTVIWEYSYVTANVEAAYSATETSDGYYLVTGYTEATSRDLLVLKLNATNGSIVWQKRYDVDGGLDYSNEIIETSDGNYVIAGFGDVTGAGYEGVILKLDPSDGSVLSLSKAYGDTNNDRLYAIDEDADGNLVAGGITESYGAGSYEFWVLSLDSSGSIGGTCDVVSALSVTEALPGLSQTGNSETVTSNMLGAGTPTSVTVTDTEPLVTIDTQCMSP